MVIALRIVLLCIALLILSPQHSLNSALTSDNNDTHNISNVVNSLIHKAQKTANHETAMQIYEEAIFVKNITHIKLYNHFGALLLYIMQNLSYAENIFNIALSLGISSNTTEDMDELARVYYNMGLCQMFLDHFNQSKLMFKQSIKMNRSVSIKLSYYDLGRLLSNHFNDYENATTLFERVLELDSTNVFACIEISKILLDLNHQFTLERSKQLFNKIIKMLGNKSVLYNDFGIMIMNKYYAWTDGRAMFLKSLAFNNSTSDSERATSFANLAMVDKHDGNYTSAVRLFKQAIGLDPQHIHRYTMLSNLLIDVFKRYHDAAKLYVDALKIEPENDGLWQKFHQMLHRHQISFGQAYALIENTNNIAIMFRFGAMLVEQKTRYEAARSLLLKCVLIDPTSSDAWYYLGVALTMLKEYTDAMTSLNKSIQLYPYWDAYHMLGTVYWQISDNIDKARKMFERAIELAPDDLSSVENSQLAWCHVKLGIALEVLFSKNETQQLKALHHFEQAISIDPKSSPWARVKYALGLIIHGFDGDAAIETMKQGLETNPNDDKLLGGLASMQSVMHKTDINTIEMFRTAIYKLKTKLPGIYMEYAKYLFRNKLQTNHGHDPTTARQIEDLFRMNLFSVSATESKEQAYHGLALLKMQTLDNKNEFSKYQQAMQIYDQGLNDMPNSCLLHVGKAYLLENQHFKQYNQSITLYQTAIQLCGNHDQHIVCKVNAMFNLASLLIDYDEYQYPNRYNYSRYLIEQACKDLIKRLNGIIVFALENEWIGSFESTMKKFININLIDVDKSLIHQILGLYYESLNRYQQAAFQFIMSIQHNHANNNNTKDLIMVSHWKWAKISSRYLNNSNTTQIMKHFSIAVDQSSHAPTMWNNCQLSELYYDFGYFLNTKMNDIWNATKYYSKSVELNSFNIKAKEQLDKIVEENEDIFSQFDQCTLCLAVMIGSYQSIHTNNCTHRFHTSCIDKWNQKKKEKVCPLCREPQS